jgi:hypothetical protein
MGKVAGQRVTFHAPARIGAIAASLAAAAALLLPNTALAATVIGSAQGNLPCPSGIDSVQITSSSNSYTVPAGGASITSWSVLAGPADTGPVGLEVWAPTPPPAPALTFTLVDIEADQTLTPGGLRTFTLATPLTVAAGDLLGVRVDGPFLCQSLVLGADTFPSTLDSFGLNVGPATVVGGSITIASPIQYAQSYQLNIAATLDVAAPPPTITVPTSTDQCKKGGWQGMGDATGKLFKNQGDCVSFVATGGTNLAG